MADAYNVRTNGSVYYVYRMDGNVPVGEFMGEGAASKAQREAAIRNQQHNERFGKKKESPVESGTDGDQPDSVVGEIQTKPYPVPQPEADSKAGKITSGKVHKVSQEKKPEKHIPNPPPGQGASY